jgi:hypothetical protein
MSVIDFDCTGDRFASRWRVTLDTPGHRTRATERAGRKQSIAISNDLLDGACTWIAKCSSLRSQVLRNLKIEDGSMAAKKKKKSAKKAAPAPAVAAPAKKKAKKKAGKKKAGKKKASKAAAPDAAPVAKTAKKAKKKRAKKA